MAWGPFSVTVNHAYVTSLGDVREDEQPVRSWLLVACAYIYQYLIRF